MRESARPTLIDVARRAGVAKTTASDALSGRGRIAEATRDAVLAAAADLGYMPNTAAQHLRHSATGTLALILPEVSARSAYYMTFAFGVISAAAHADYDVTVVTRPSGQQRPRQLRADGIIIADPRKGDPVTAHLLEGATPVVTTEHVLEGPKPDGVVYSDHADAMTRLMAHLERTRFAHPALIVAADDTDWTASLARAFRAGCAERGVTPLVRHTSFEAPSRQVRAAAESLLADHPEVDAVIVAPDGGAVEVLSVLNRAGRAVGHDISLASCVDYPALASIDPPVTAVDLRPHAAGVVATELMLELIGGSAAPAEREHPIEVIARESTDGSAS